MNLLIARLLVDFGFLILIWISQIIIYPSFLYYSQKNFLIWHKKYLTKINFITAPLLVLQSTIIALQLFYNNINLYNITSAVIILCLIILTFFEAIPLHLKLNRVGNLEIIGKTLIQKNKSRTFLWTLLFLLSLIHYIMDTAA